MGTLFFILFFLFLVLIMPLVIGAVKVYRNVRLLFKSAGKFGFSFQEAKRDSEDSTGDCKEEIGACLGKSVTGRKRLDRLKMQAVDVCFEEVIDNS